MTTYFTIFVDLQGIMAFLVLLFTDFWIKDYDFYVILMSIMLEFVMK